MIAQVLFGRHVLNLVYTGSVAKDTLRDTRPLRRRPQSCGSSIRYIDQWMWSNTHDHCALYVSVHDIEVFDS